MKTRSIPTAAVHARILLVDDNVDGLTARSTVLAELGHTVTIAHHGVEALALFCLHKYDLVITDYRMPEMDGLELIRQIRDRAEETPVVLISGYVEPLGLCEATTGADAVIQKSANEVPQMVRTVSRLLRAKPMRRKRNRGEDPPLSRTASA